MNGDLVYYLDTSVLGGAVDPEASRRNLLDQLFAGQQAGKWTLVSGIPLIEEVSQAPENVRMAVVPFVQKLSSILEEDEESRAVAEEVLVHGVVPEGAVNDARHLSIGIVHEVTAVVSWNFKHMVNPLQRRRVQALCMQLRYAVIDVISPWEVIHEES
jgi:hypothetical protein